MLVCISHSSAFNLYNFVDFIVVTTDTIALCRKINELRHVSSVYEGPYYGRAFMTLNLLIAAKENME